MHICTLNTNNVPLREEFLMQGAEVHSRSNAWVSGGSGTAPRIGPEMCLYSHGDGEVDGKADRRQEGELDVTELKNKHIRGTSRVGCERRFR